MEICIFVHIYEIEHLETMSLDLLQISIGDRTTGISNVKIVWGRVPQEAQSFSILHQDDLRHHEAQSVWKRSHSLSELLSHRSARVRVPYS
jgi:hypothetical protein